MLHITPGAGGKRKRRVMRTFYNDAGEEVTGGLAALHFVASSLLIGKTTRLMCVHRNTLPAAVAEMVEEDVEEDAALAPAPSAQEQQQVAAEPAPPKVRQGCQTGCMMCNDVGMVSGIPCLLAASPARPAVHQTHAAVAPRAARAQACSKTYSRQRRRQEGRQGSARGAEGSEGHHELLHKEVTQECGGAWSALTAQ